ncbi:MAG: hypothetical protein JO154_09360 [Chitinophaga sp.]|uniref:transglutaminase domain-containing protein n=1 Tax=Chitinophaga sp. TaxID=1869181 RepID=UPI0025C66BB9|nr:transglutaminase domain-containing protein [Chitinophaga sp.]MBV8252800.1 hypothetical protein [Chitinophaga sp.]
MRVIAMITGVMLTVVTVAQGQSNKPKTVANPVTTYTTIPDTEVMTTTAMADWLKANSKNTTESLKSIYAWIGKNIAYDTRNTYDPQYYKDTTDAAAKTLRTRQGICYGYASLFVEIARKAGISAILVSGYTVNGGQLSADGSHAWVAVKTDNKWTLIDPTWAAGGVSGTKFYPSFTWKYFMISPAVFVKTHVPYDPIYQFLDHPYRHDEIKEGKLTLAASRPVFVYEDSLAMWQKLDSNAQVVSSIERIRRFGVSNAYISTELSYLLQKLEVTRHNEEVTRQNAKVESQNQLIDRYNAANSKYNVLVSTFNDYVHFKNNQFTPAKPDQEIREWVDGMAADLAKIYDMIKDIKLEERKHQEQVDDTRQLLDKMKPRIDEEQAFVTKYLKTGKMFRKSLFYKFRWM